MSATGVITGGWGYVTAAYLVSLVILACYAASVVQRYRAEARRVARERSASGVP